MKKFLFIAWMLFNSIACYSQMVVESEFVEPTNRLNSQFTFPTGEDVTQDLFFSIGPSGIPQYGQSVNWNLNPGTEGVARFFHVKKGDWDRSAIRTEEEVISFESSAINYPVGSTPNTNMGEDWIKLGKSWNFSHDNYAIAVISFTNQRKDVIKDGRIRFSHPNLDFVSIPDVFIYNDWVKLVSVNQIDGRKIYEYEYENLLPEEIRHVYIKVDLSIRPAFKFSEVELIAEMVGFQEDMLISEGIIPPHDPNALTLLTGLESITDLGDCDSYDEYPDLQDACDKGQPYWINCTDTDDEKCRFRYSLNYPYCNEDSEFLTYRATCLNDGAGVAKDIDILASFDLRDSPFLEDVFEFNGSHDLNGEFLYPKVKFIFKDIKLPGLTDESYVYTYDECSAEAVFLVKTKCNLDTPIKARAVITFYDLGGSSVGDVETNEVLIVPEQNVYTNYEPSCISCLEDDSRSDSRSSKKNISLRQTNSELNISFDRDSQEDLVSIKIFNVSGQLLKEQSVFPNGSIQLNEQLDISNLRAGIYFISIQSGNNNFVEKFIQP